LCSPLLQSRQFRSASASAARPDAYACVEFSRYQGAKASLGQFHSRRRTGSIQGPGLISCTCGKTFLDKCQPPPEGKTATAPHGRLAPTQRKGRVQDKSESLERLHAESAVANGTIRTTCESRSVRWTAKVTRAYSTTPTSARSGTSTRMVPDGSCRAGTDNRPLRHQARRSCSRHRWHEPCLRAS
jgi:hypothetical protein